MMTTTPNGRLIAGRYQIEDVVTDLLGQGGMGSVYRAYDQKTEQIVAVKQLRSDLVHNNPDQLARFVREGELLRQLNHPNIVKLLGTAVEQEDHYLIMEYVAGGSLRDLLNQQPQLPEKQVLTIGLELADALSRAHHLQIVHRDIKPGNVLLAEDGTPRLTDFGLAHAAGSSELTRSGTLAGTFAYLSPEVCHGQLFDSRADIWSFGVMLYEMLAGQNPFERSHVAATLTAIVRDPLPKLNQFRPDVTEELQALIAQMVVKDREERLGSARIVGATLESILHGSHSSTSWRVGSQVRSIPSSSIVAPKEPAHNLPAYATPFIGRQQELTAVTTRLADPTCRLLSILGPGGVGKSRLAIQAAREQLTQFADGIFHVSLASLTDPNLFIPALAEATQFAFYTEKSGATDPTRQFINFLREKQMLLLLDNAETILENRPLIADILASCPHVKLLVTSSQRLNLQGEWTLPLSGLPLPVIEDGDEDHVAHSVATLANYEAVQFFAQCAARVAPHFTLTPENTTAVAEICRLVGGLPLGIELAAAWTQLLSAAEIVTEIRDSFDFLQSEMVNIPERHRSLRATFEYSWARLTAAERQALRRLSIFHHSFSREAAGAVALEGSPATRLTQLSALLNKSLLKRLDANRYQIHELLRQYAAQKLESYAEETAVTAQQHALYYTTFLQQQTDALHRAQQLSAAQAIERDMENVRAAWRWLTTVCADLDLVETAVSQAQKPLVNFHHRRNLHEEGANLCRQATAVLRRLPPAVPLAYSLTYEASFLIQLGQLTAAETYLQEGLTLFDQLDHPAGLAEVHLWQGHLAYHRGEFTPAVARYEQSQHLFRQVEEPVGLAESLAALGRIAGEQGEYDRAAPVYEESLAIRRQLDDRLKIAETLNGLAVIAYRQGEATAVKALAEEGLAIYKELDHQAGIAGIWQRLAMAAGIAGDYPQAIQFYQRSMAVFKRLGNQAGIASCLINLNHNANLLADYAAGQRYGQEGVAMARQLQDRVTLMYALNNVGHSSCKLGDYAAAEAQFYEALTIAHDTNAIPIALEILGGLAELFHENGRTPLALEILACIQAHPALIEETERLLAASMAEMVAELSEETAVLAQAAGSARSVEALIADLVSEL